MKRFLPLVVSLMLVACGLIQPPDKLLFSDGFSDPQSGWKVWANDRSFVTYDTGSLRFFINQPNLDMLSLPGKKYDDTLLFVSAQLSAGATDNHYGLICRYRDEENYYAFLISSDGYAGIIKVKEGQVELLSASQMEYQPAIRQGLASNDIAAGCVGNELGLVINSQTIYQVKDDDFSSGEIGLLAGTQAQPGVDIRFDNLVVLRP